MDTAPTNASGDQKTAIQTRDVVVVDVVDVVMADVVVVDAQADGLRFIEGIRTYVGI